jgi:hypothetical protein
MAIGCYTPSPVIIHGPMSATLAEAVVADPTSVAMTLAPATIFGARGAWAEPEIATEPARGVDAPEHDGQWFERIHVLPGTVNIGYLMNNREVDVEVWNACRRGLTLTSIPVDGPSGVTIFDEELQDVALPQHYAPMQSRVYTAWVSVVGESLIDNLGTWVFSERSFRGASIKLLGWRMVVFAVKPNGSLVESLGYLTDVIQSWNGSEQRIGLRSIPDRELRFKGTACSQVAAQKMLTRLLVTGRFMTGVPLWPDAIELSTAVSIGSYQIAIDTVGRDFSVGGLCILWRDADSWETFQIVSIEADHIHLSSPAEAAWPLQGTLCIPLLNARSLEDFRVARSAGDLAEVVVAFYTEPI